MSPLYVTLNAGETQTFDIRCCATNKLQIGRPYFSKVYLGANFASQSRAGVSARTRQLILAALGTLVCVGTNTAQTANELRQKYGSPGEKGNYMVRPEIAMSVLFAKDGQACKVLIKPLPQLARKDSLPVPLESEIVSKIIDEIVPISLRGRRGRSISLSGWVTMTDYENVRIRRTMVSKSDSTKGESAIEIVWKKRGCE